MQHKPHPLDVHDRVDEPTLVEAALDVIEAGQQVVVDRIELLRAEVRQDAAHFTLGVGLVVAASVVMLFGYFTMQAALVVWLAGLMATELALLIVGVVHLLVGIVLAMAGLYRFQNMPYAIPGPMDGERDQESQLDA